MFDNRNNHRGPALLPGHASDQLPASASPNEGIGLRDVMRILRRRLWTVTAVTVAVAAAAAYFVRGEYPQYRATATLRLADLRGQMTEGLGDQQPDQSGRVVNPQLSKVQLLTSRSLVGAVVDSLSLRLRPDFHGFANRLLSDVQVALDAPTDTLLLRFDSATYSVQGSRRRAGARYGQPVQLDGVKFVVLARPRTAMSTWFVYTREATIDLVLSNLRVTPRPATDVVDVSYVAYRPRIAQGVVNSIVERYRVQDVEQSREEARRRRVFLEGQLAETDASVADAQRALGDFRRRAQLFSAKDKLAAQQTNLMSLDTQRATLIAERGMLASLVSQLHQSPNASPNFAALMASPELAADPGISTLYRQLAELRVQRDSLTTGAWSSPPSDPAVKRLDALTATTNAHMEDAIRGHLSGVDARLAALDGLRGATAAVIEGLPSLESEEVQLLQRVASTQTLADQLRAEYERARLAEAVEIGGVSIVDRAALPYQLAGIPRALQLVLGAIVGLLLGTVLAILLEVMNTSIRGQDEVEEALHLPTLGVIPRAAVDLPQLGGEPYRIVRTNLLYSSHMQGLRTLVVTSALAREGKTAVASNLAISFAREGLRVLLVDCDLRRPRLHQVFGVSRSPGLAQVLDESLSLDAVTRETSVPGLSVVPCGSLPANPGEIVRGARIRALLAAIGPAYDFVILDTPPVLPVADASIVGAVSDGVLMVVRAGKTSRALTQEACARLASVGANVVGTVLNDPTGRNVETYTYGSEVSRLAVRRRAVHR